MTTAFTKRLGIALVVVASVAILAVGGWFVLSSVLGVHEPRELVVVTTHAPGLSPEDVERSVVTPLEQALSGLAGVTSLRSESRDGVGIVTVTFDGDVFVFQQAAQKAVSDALSTPPQGLVPELRRVAAEPIEERYVVRADTWDALTLSKWVNETFVRSLEVQFGVRNVEVCGSVEATRVVTLDPQKLAAFGVSMRDAVDAIEGSDDLDTVNIGPVSLRDVARVETTGMSDGCRAQVDGVPVQLVTVARFVEGQTTLAALPAGVTLARFTLPLAAEYTAPTDRPVRLDGLSVQRGMAVTSYAPTATPSKDVALLRKPDGVVVRVFGEDLEVLKKIALVLYDKAEDFAWRGLPWPILDVPRQRVKVDERSRERARTVNDVMRLMLTGERRRDVMVKVEGELQSARLDDGTPLTDVVTIQNEVGPELVLHVNRQRAIEVAIGGSEREVRRMVEQVSLPPGIHVTVTAR
ncbi:MAG: efflux RND transporter permease subunit [Archangium sp.]